MTFAATPIWHPVTEDRFHTMEVLASADQLARDHCIAVVENFGWGWIGSAYTHANGISSMVPGMIRGGAYGDNVEAAKSWCERVCGLHTEKPGDRRSDSTEAMATPAPLDPKFPKVVALMRSTQHEGERTSARTRAEAMAAAAGMTLDEAIATAHEPVPPSWGDIFSGFDDFMEREEPGWKARCVEEQADRRRKNARKRAAIIDKYGSEDLALAPCQRETLLRDAVAPWRNPCDHNDRWTDNLDGWSDYIIYRDRMPAHVLAAIETAYPLPRSFGEAKAEHEYWTARDDEMGLILDTSGLGYGDIALDIPARVRAEIVRDLVFKDLVVGDLRDLLCRFQMYRALENHDEYIEAALCRDLEMLVDRQHPFNRSTFSELRFSPNLVETSLDVPAMDQVAKLATCSAEGIRNGSLRQIGEPCGRVASVQHQSTRGDQIRAALDADPSRSDRDIARVLGCSPTTVGKTRGSMGLSGADRSVQRGGKMYSMRAPAAGAAS